MDRRVFSTSYHSESLLRGLGVIYEKYYFGSMATKVNYTLSDTFYFIPIAPLECGDFNKTINEVLPVN